MKSFVYTGPLSGVSLKDAGDVMLIPGAIVQLPAGHEYTARLVRKGWLTEVEGQAEAATQPQAADSEEEQQETVTDTEPITDKKRRK